jgi:hypothetical protein
LLLPLLLLLQLLEKVTNSQAQQEKADRHKDLEQQRALDMLPGTFDVLRAVFGDKGPCVKPKSEVSCLCGLQHDFCNQRWRFSASCPASCGDCIVVITPVLLICCPLSNDSMHITLMTCSLSVSALLLCCALPAGAGTAAPEEHLQGWHVIHRCS